MNKTLIFILFAIYISQTQQKLIFSDDFTDLESLSKNWKHELTMGGGGNWEFQVYTNNRSNSYVKDGILYIKPTLTSDMIGEAQVRNGGMMDIWGDNPATQCTGNAFYGCQRGSGGSNIINPISSARLRTAETFSFKYGRVEFRAQLPKGDWLWPALWLLPRHNIYGNWPASGEIDVIESRGNVNYPKSSGGGPASIGSTLHWGPDWTENQFMKTHQQYDLSSGTFADKFHTFGLVWNEKELYTYIDTDSNKILHVDFTKESMWKLGNFPSKFKNIWENRKNNAPFDSEFYLIMNLAVGGVAGYFPDGVDGKPWNNNSQQAALDFYNNIDKWYPSWNGEDTAMKVDWVKVWDIYNSQGITNEEQYLLDAQQKQTQ